MKSFSNIIDTPAIILLIAIALLFLIARRRFQRRGVGGLQHFSTFENGIVITFFEWLLKWVARFSIIGVIIYYLIHKQ